MKNFDPNLPIDASTVNLTIKQHMKIKSYGSDGIALRYILGSLPVILSHLTTTANTYIGTKKLPSAWKYATITIPKIGDRNEIHNYRPMSLLPMLSKVLKKIVVRQLTAFLEADRSLYNTQHDSRSKLSTDTVLTTLTNEIGQNMEY